MREAEQSGADVLTMETILRDARGVEDRAAEKETESRAEHVFWEAGLPDRLAHLPGQAVEGEMAPTPCGCSSRFRDRSHG